MYTKDELYYALCPMGSIDLNAIIDKCNDWEIDPYDAVEYARQNHCFEVSPHNNANNCNAIFYTLFNMRVGQILELARNSLEDCNGTRKKMLRKKLEYLVEHLENKGYEEIHINAFCSCFDSNVIDSELEYIKTQERLIE